MKKITWAIIGLIAIVGIAFYYYQPVKNPQQDDKELLGEQSNVPDTIAGNVWKGTLKTSDMKAKGNLMLVFPDQTRVYIQTSRDFSNLMDKEVSVEYSGTKDNFKLIEIHPK